MRWEIPGPRRYIERVVDALHMGKHAVLVVPSPVAEDGLHCALDFALRAAGLGELGQLEVGPDVHAEPLSSLSLALGLQASALASIDDLLEHTRAPSRFLMLAGVDRGPAERQARWAAILARAASQTQVAGWSSVQIVARLTPGSPTPRRDLYLAVESWWGVMGQVDLDHVVERSLERFPPERPAGHYWARSLCRGLACWDPLLAGELVQAMPRSIEEVMALLLRQGEGRSAVSADLERLNYLNGVLLGDAPPPAPRNGDDLQLWRDGWLDFMPGRGQILHSSLMARMPGARERIARRIWSGQQEILLPVVEQVRLSVLESLCREHGDGWMEALFRGVSAALVEDRCAEIGLLCHLMTEERRFWNLDGGRARRLLVQWKNIRNALAHSEMVTYEALDEALESFRSYLKEAR